MTPIRIRLRELREKKGLSQQALAHLASVRQATISELESGNAQGLRFETLDRLSNVLGIEPGELFVRTPTEKASRKGRRAS